MKKTWKSLATIIAPPQWELTDHHLWKWKIIFQPQPLKGICQLPGGYSNLFDPTGSFVVAGGGGIKVKVDERGPVWWIWWRRQQAFVQMDTLKLYVVRQQILSGAAVKLRSCCRLLPERMFTNPLLPCTFWRYSIGAWWHDSPHLFSPNKSSQTYLVPSDN